MYDKVDTLLNSTSKLMLDELRQEGEPIRFIDILERDKNWKCPTCEASLSKDVIFCQACQLFRPLEMFKNILHDPQNVSDFELNFIDQRRKMEKQLILNRDIQSQEEEEEENAHDGENSDKDKIENGNDEKKASKKMWFMISGDWLF